MVIKKKKKKSVNPKFFSISPVEMTRSKKRRHPRKGQGASHKAIVSFFFWRFDWQRTNNIAVAVVIIIISIIVIVIIVITIVID